MIKIIFYSFFYYVLNTDYWWSKERSLFFVSLTPSSDLHSTLEDKHQEEDLVLCAQSRKRSPN